MAKTIAYVYGTALTPGVSRNGRYYSPQLIKKAVTRAQGRINAGDILVSRDLDSVTEHQQPLTSLTHHAAEDDSEKIVGRIDQLTFDEATGAAKYKLAVPDTHAGRTIVNLADTSDGPPFLRGMSIRGAWIGPVRYITTPDGQTAETADSLELDGLDFTRKPGVLAALIDRVERVIPAAPSESDVSRTLIYESAPEAHVVITEAAEDNMVPGCDGSCCDNCGVNAKTITTESVAEKGAPALKSGKPATPQTKAKNYADPGYQDDKMKRYALDTPSQVRAANSYINMPKNAAKYTPQQLKRIKGRIKAAAKKFGIKIEEGWLIMPPVQVTEADLLEYMPDGAGGSFAIDLTNGPVCLRLSSYIIDPADLEVVGVAAMSAAVAALKSLDPDLDADIDVPGADAEDTDDDMNETSVPAPSAVTETEPGDSETAAPAPVTVTSTEEEPGVSEQPTTPAAGTPAPVTAPAPAGITLSAEQFEQLMTRLTPGGAPAPQLVSAAAETAPTAPVSVVETEDQRIARLVAEGVKAALTPAVQEHVERYGPPARKGLVTQVAEAAGTRGSDDIPEGWPAKSLHEYTSEERRKYFGPTVEQAFMGRHSVYRDDS